MYKTEKGYQVRNFAVLKMIRTLYNTLNGKKRNFQLPTGAMDNSKGQPDIEGSMGSSGNAWTLKRLRKHERSSGVVGHKDEVSEKKKTGFHLPLDKLNQLKKTKLVFKLPYESGSDARSRLRKEAFRSGKSINDTEIEREINGFSQTTPGHRILNYPSNHQSTTPNPKPKTSAFGLCQQAHDQTPQTYCCPPLAKTTRSRLNNLCSSLGQSPKTTRGKSNRIFYSTRKKITSVLFSKGISVNDVNIEDSRRVSKKGNGYLTDRGPYRFKGSKG